jgi:hypothetical protein
MLIDISVIMYTVLAVYILLGTIAAFSAYRILKRVVHEIKVLWALLHAKNASQKIPRKAQMPPVPKKG